MARPTPEQLPYSIAPSTAEDNEIAARIGCEAMLRAMLLSGQHYWSQAGAERLASDLGMTHKPKRGIGDATE